MNEVRVYDGQGKLKETIGVKQLNNKMWKRAGVTLNMQYKEETGACQECGKAFPLVSKHQKYCKTDGLGESDCSKAAYRRRKKVPRVEKECAECGQKFMGAKSRVFCQNPCKGIAKKSEAGPIPARPCAICKKIYQPKSNRGKFCGDPCNWYDAQTVQAKL